MGELKGRGRWAPPGARRSCEEKMNMIVGQGGWKKVRLCEKVPGRECWPSRLTLADGMWKPERKRPSELEPATSLFRTCGRTVPANARVLQVRSRFL